MHTDRASVGDYSAAKYDVPRMSIENEDLKIMLSRVVTP